MKSDETGHSSFIHDLQIATPCKANWDEMTGDEQKRFCGACKLNVYNISAMTLPEAEKLVSEAEGRLCVRMYRRADGTVITQDCPVGLAERMKRRMQKTFAFGTAAVTILMAWVVNLRINEQPSLWEQLSAVWSEKGTTQGAGIMGEMACPPKGGVPMTGSIAPIQGKIAPAGSMEIKGNVAARSSTQIEFLDKNGQVIDNPPVSVNTRGDSKPTAIFPNGGSAPDGE